MTLINRVNLIQDGEPLDGVGDNPDVLNRPVKQIIDILESGDQDTLLVQKTNIKVSSTDFEIGVSTGDLVYYNTSIDKFSKASISTAEFITGIADLNRDIVVVTGNFNITGSAFDIGRLVYLSNSIAGKITAAGASDQSDYPVGIALSSTEVLLKNTQRKEIDDDEIGDVFINRTQTLFNKTMIGTTNTIAANYNHLKFINRTGSTLDKGTLISLNGWDSSANAPSVLRSSNSDFYYPSVGIVMSDSPANSYGLIMTDGLIEGINTSAFLENDFLYVGNVPGTITNIRPSTNAQSVGYVVRRDNTNGSIYIAIDVTASDIDFIEFESDFTTLQRRFKMQSFGIGLELGL